MEQEILKLEQVCTAMYQTNDVNIRQQAEKVLVEFVNDPLVLDKCQLLLQRAASPYAILIAASTLTKRVTKQGSPLPQQQRLDIRNYILSYLYSGSKQPAFVQESLALLYARITKIAWFDSFKEEWPFRNVISDISKFLQGNTEQCNVGIQLLTELVADINRSDNIKPLTRHRKIAASFRDTTLFEIFQLACSMLNQALVSGEQIQRDEQCTLLGAVLQLTLNCLSFDFIGTSYDDSGDDLITVQIPTGWRSTFVDLSTSQLFLNLYNVLPESLCAIVMSCIVQIVSVRRSLFNNTERIKFLSDILKGIKGILENPQKLSEESTFHEFCRMIARLKANYQLGELVKTPCYLETMQLVANFTVTSLRMWHFSPNSIHYLLSLWQRMAASVPYIKAPEPHRLENFMPEVLKAYVESRLESVEVILRDGLENPLDDMSFIKQQLEQISTIARCEYSNTCQLLVQTFDESASNLEELLRSSSDGQRLLLPLGKLTWIIHLVGAVIGGRVSFAATDEHDAMDGELVIRVLQLMAITDRRLPEGNGNSTIELAFLSFFEQFRKIYVGDQVQKSSKVYKRLGEVLQLGDDSAVLSVFVGKIITNLKYWSHSDEIVKGTLHLLGDLSVGFSSVRKLVKLDAVQFLLENDPSQHFPFLGTGSKMSDLKCRTVFYTALGRLLAVDLGEDEERFIRFMQPMTATFEKLKQMMQTAASNHSSLHSSTIRTLIGLARDIRGITYSFNCKNTYAMLFELVYPTFTDIVQSAMELWYPDPTLTTPILRMFGELVLNRGQRLNFDVSSPNGILLFKEASKLMCAYGTRILSLGEPPKEQLYSHRLKGISLCFSLLKNALSGSYVNFGVFRLYNDSTLDDALNVFVELVMSIQANYLLEYPKLSHNYHTLLELVAQDHMGFISGLPANVTYHLLGTLTEGLTALDTVICTCCCTALDHVVTYLFRIAARAPALTNGDVTVTSSAKTRHGQLERQRERHFLQVMMERPQILQNALTKVLHTIMFEDCRNQWSMSRPLLGLILLNQDYLQSLEKSLCEPGGDHGSLDPASLHNSFTQLMNGVDKNLHTKTRDRFTQNMSIFRRDITDLIKAEGRSSTSSAVDLTTSSNSMMT
uniref:Exportin-7-A-like n=1 Tax=Phallusia mammillata TaxID=59560 RepID=A0A6F9DXN2_9ASCI|nr:exportin-7-A-like [Phallusia mammillata]